MAGNRLNRLDAAVMTEQEMLRRWRRAGLSREQQEDERLYRVGIANLALLELRRINRIGKTFGSGEAIVQARDHPAEWPEDGLLRRVIRTAIAGLYAVGIDIGEADVALGTDGRASMRAARKNRKATPALWEKVILPQDAKLLIGADPEFVLIRPDGKIAPASRYLGEGVGGAAGSDAMLVGRRLVYPVAELRPEPAADVAGLAANVRRLLLRAAELVRDPSLRWAAGAMPVPGLALGGHIHLSGVRLTPRLLRLLDSYAAMPLALVEDPAGRGRRPRYGILGDYRLQPHGGFEYRTLPSWLVSPAAAKAAFALALLCAREADALHDIPALDERYVEAYYAGDRTELAGCLDRVAGAMSATDSYAALAPYIEPVLDAARRGVTWDERADIRIKWRIPQP
ncbi:putative amidoligase domain-containing protein [Paenibacillus sp. YAF4_2]|uniref:putative amidoligase domain-containing protein n=1 Tax=Paenibacillus sp. YAF4_2 TaxID=3233085 RepID=UPI003F98C6AD